VHQLFIDFEKAYDSVRRETLYNILIEFGVPRKLVRLIKLCLTETYSRVRVGKNLSDRFPIRNGLKQGDALSPLLFNFALEWAIRRVQVNQDSLKLNVTHQLLAYADDVNPLNPELNPICYLLALLGAHHFLRVSRIRVKLLTFRLLMSYIYGAPILDVSRSHTTTQHSR